MNISVVGLGKLGLCTAACFAMKGHKVTGVEKNRLFVEELNARRCPISETNLPETLEKAWGNLTVTEDIGQAVNNSDVTLIITPTPSTEDGSFTNEYIETVLREMAPFLKEKQGFHIVDVVSTVMPGSCGNEFAPLLEGLTGKKCGEGFGLVYNPEFIALGSVIKDFLNPDMVLIGASDDFSANTVEKLYLECVDSKPQICKVSLVNAEITKISLNCYVTMKISYANQLAAICEKVSGADVDVISAAVGADSRVGKKYLKGGLGFGGPCFPRDNAAFQTFAERFGGSAPLGKQVIEVNSDVVARLCGIVERNVKRGGKVAILGMSYKPGTHITEESQSVMLAEMLAGKGFAVSCHDPAAQGENITRDIDVCVKGADAIILMVEWPEYKGIDMDKLSESATPGAVFIDCWRTFKDSGDMKLKYIGVGMGEKRQ
jgi:UDPglucose 6-dehydrogenase